MFYEIVVAPGYTEKGLGILKGKSKTLRILEAKRSEKGMLSLRQVSGGWLAQESDDLAPEDITFTKVSQRAPTDGELSDARFAWLCAKHVKSNAIVIAKVSAWISHVVPRKRVVTSMSCSLHHQRYGSLNFNLLVADHAPLILFLRTCIQNNCMLGMGSGQPNRVDSLRIAFRKAGEEAKGASLASDAFFPFGERE